jgi:hypothetical protein
MGCDDVSKCEYLNLPRQPDEQAPVIEQDLRFPWSGRPFGLTDLRFVAGCRRPHVVGLVGPENAGKTTLLAMLFLMLSRGVKIGEGRRFAGSFTLEGWENIAQRLQLRPPFPVSFPPHTPNNPQRQPGLLHLALSDAAGAMRDVVLTDAPGEWFSAWTDDAGVEAASGARWIASHADRSLLIADTGALTGARAGPSRMSFQFLTRRLATATGGRATALVWTKTDRPRSGKLIADIEGIFRQQFADGPVFSVQVPPPAAESGLGHVAELAAVYDWAMMPTQEQARVQRAIQSRTEAEDPFFAYAGSAHE